MTPDPPPVAASLTGVREVSLLGRAKPALWRELLQPEGLTPLERDGRAQLMVVAAAARYKGIPFQEISFSVLVEPVGAFLVQAFNSSRIFAWVERTFFSTPYARGRLTVEPTVLRLDSLFRAALRGPLGDPVEETWEGPIYLPGGTRVFHARLSGATSRGSFLPERDVLEIARSRRFPVFDLLLDSKFKPQEWILRPNASHTKSKTVAR